MYGILFLTGCLILGVAGVGICISEFRRKNIKTPCYKYKKMLPRNEKTMKYLNTLDDIYLVSCWTNFGYRTYKFSGKYSKDPFTGFSEPLVWQYDDHNGTCDNYYLRPIHLTTTGFDVCWVFSEREAQRIADSLNKTTFNI